MARRAAAALAAIALAAVAGCGPAAPPPGVSYRFRPPVLLPEPGVTNILSPADRGYRQRCYGQAPSLTLDAATVEPERVRPGQPVNHRLVYTYCAAPGSAAIPGRLVTRIDEAGGEVLAEDTVEDFRLAPGQWAADARIVIPADAAPGAYRITTRFEGAAGFERSVAFTVE